MRGNQETRAVRRANIIAALALVLALCFALRARSLERPFDETQFWQTYHAMDRFARKYQGCPEQGFPPAVTCGGSQLDLDLWRKAVHEACLLGGGGGCS